MTIRDYTMSNDLYIMNLFETNIVFVIQWLFSIGEHSMNYKIPEMRFKNSNGKQVVLKGMNTYPIRWCRPIV